MTNGRGSRFIPVVAGALVLLGAGGRVDAANGTYGRIEASFELPQVRGNVFDYAQSDVRATIAGPDGREVTLPAFFDGGALWRVRHTPTSPGRYVVRTVTLNGSDARPQNLQPAEFAVAASRPSPGFVRISPTDRMRFAYDDGTPYYPLGYNLAWHHKGQPPMPPLVDSIARMGRSGVNWTRIWMNHWDDKNLDWIPRESSLTQPPPGELSLPVARHWDEIVTAAEASGVAFQLVLQHHGQVTVKTNPNWDINPWNKANGGWLDEPAQFFTDARAKALTKAKYRYIIARWGYSPAIMAWELFNEVEYADALTTHVDDVAAWHAEMAAFIREQDPYKHLITTSSRISEKKLWPAMDYYQSHVYAPDMLTAVANLESHALDRPYFYGEIGSAAEGQQVAPGETIHHAVWASLMSQSAGAAQYWYWYLVEPDNLLFHYTAARRFIDQSKVLAQRGLRPLDVGVETGSRGTLRFGPGTGWAPSQGTRFNVRPAGTVEGVGGMSAYLQGAGKNREMFPFAEFTVSYATPGTFAVRIDEFTVSGARLELSLDGKPAAALTLVAPQRPEGATTRPARNNVRSDATLEVAVPAGAHTIRLENTGGDWVHLRQFTLTPYAPQLGALGKGNSDFAVVWVYRREPGDAQPVAGTLTVPGLADGNYRVVWFDTYKGEVIDEQPANVSAGKPLRLETSPVASDVAVWISKPNVQPTR